MKLDGASPVYENPIVPLGHPGGSPTWDGFHLRPRLGGLYAERDEQEE